MLDHVNATRAAHIVTLEDPIEVLLSDKSSMVSQRELGVDARTAAEAMRHINRLDPDVIFVSELTDADTIREVLSAAGAGHLVLATVTTVTASETINHLVGLLRDRATAADPPHAGVDVARHRHAASASTARAVVD